MCDTELCLCTPASPIYKIRCRSGLRLCMTLAGWWRSTRLQTSTGRFSFPKDTLPMQAEPFAAVPDTHEVLKSPGGAVPSSDHSTSGMSGSVVGDSSTVASEARPPSPGAASLAYSVDPLEVERQNPFGNPPKDAVPSLSVSASSDTQTSYQPSHSSNSRASEIQHNPTPPPVIPDIQSLNGSGHVTSSIPLPHQPQPIPSAIDETFELSYQNPFPMNSTTSSEADDEDTAPSSTGRRNPSTDGAEVESALQRIIETTKRRLGNMNRRDSEDEEVPGVLIAGYLQKLGRNGKWQTRWFEVDGECLSYYKSSKRVKCLATLDLQKVSSWGLCF